MTRQPPALINGGQFKDARGTIKFNNAMNMAQVKRMYTIENSSVDFVRAWQGHQIEQRWFTAVQGRFKISVVLIDTWPNPSRDAQPATFVLDASQLDVLHIPAGYLSSIQQLEQHAVLMVYADYTLGEVDDEFKLDAAYFNN